MWQQLLFPVLTVQNSQIIQIKRQTQIPVQMLSSTLPGFLEEETSAHKYQLGWFMIFSLHPMSAQLASTWCTFDKKKNVIHLLHPVESDPRHLLDSGACLVFLGHKLLRTVRNISYYFTNIRTDLHIHTEILEGGNERRVYLPQSLVSIGADAQTQAHPLEDGKQTSVLEEGPSAAHTSGSNRVHGFCGLPGPAIKGKPSQRAGRLGRHSVAAGEIGLHSKSALPFLTTV